MRPGSPVGHHTAAPPSGARPRSRVPARGRFSAFVVAAGIVVGLVTGTALGAAFATTAGGHDEHHRAGVVDSEHGVGARPDVELDLDDGGR